MAGDAPTYTIVVCFEDEARRRFLMVRNRRRGWELPGGRVEAGEAPEHGALREFEEETGHTILALRRILVQRRDNGTGHIFDGVMGPPAARVAGPEEAIVEKRFVDRLGDVAPLAFPDDPYGPIEAALGRRLR